MAADDAESTRMLLAETGTFCTLSICFMCMCAGASTVLSVQLTDIGAQTALDAATSVASAPASSVQMRVVRRGMWVAATIGGTRADPWARPWP